MSKFIFLSYSRITNNHNKILDIINLRIIIIFTQVDLFFKYSLKILFQKIYFFAVKFYFK